MKLNGRIDKLHSFVATDPSYDSNVWCRYEAHPTSDKPWKAQLLLRNVDEMVHDDDFNADYHIQGVDFTLFLCDEDHKFKLYEDGCFEHYKSTILKEYTIGADTACIAIGANDMTNEILDCKDIWQPPCALRTLTDGEIGVVTEGRDNGEISFIMLNGFLDKDTCYSIEDLKNYFVHQLNIKDIVMEKEGNIAEKMNDAKEKAEASAEKTDVTDLDDMEK